MPNEHAATEEGMPAAGVAPAPAGPPLRVLVADDSEDDFFLIDHKLRASGFELTIRRVSSMRELEREIAANDWDLVLSDFSMPELLCMDALRVLKASRLAQVPFIIVSGSIGEERAVAALKAGAANYVMKSNLDKLVPVVERELQDAQMRRERQQA